ncbi:MAG: hypothetical protein M3156_08425 [Thermoproteota archaeon]|nr:hypothetical protein [Thermoproteota archaeon]
MTVADPKRSEEFYLRVLGGEVIRSGEPTIIQIANSWKSAVSWKLVFIKYASLWKLALKKARP